MQAAPTGGGRPPFAVSGESYDRFMGRYSARLAPAFADFAGIDGPMRVLDVGCGPGALTTVLAARAGLEGLSAVDPAEGFVEVCRTRVPGADVQVGAAESLPFADGSFDAALSQLVVSFMRDAAAGVGEMRRVVRTGGLVAFSMWAAGEMEMLGIFWAAAAAVQGEAGQSGDAKLPYRTREELQGLADGAGLEDVRTDLLPVTMEYEGFDDFWIPLQTAAGPVGAFYSSLNDAGQERLHDECRRRLGDPAGPFTLSASAWAIRGRP